MAIAIKVENDEFLRYYGQHPYVRGFSREQQDVILQQITALQKQADSPTDVSWKEIFVDAAICDKETMINMYEGYLNQWTDEIIESAHALNNDKLDVVIKDIPLMGCDELLVKYLELLQTEPVFMSLACKIIAKHGRLTELPDGSYLTITTSLPDEPCDRQLVPS